MIDHYEVLGLPSGKEGRKLTICEIRKAYKLRALELHPDKRLSDPNAVAKFQKLKISYEFLMNDRTRKAFDNLRRSRQEEEIIRCNIDPDRKRHRNAFIAKAEEEIARFRAWRANQSGY